MTPGGLEMRVLVRFCWALGLLAWGRGDDDGAAADGAPPRHDGWTLSLAGRAILALTGSTFGSIGEAADWDGVALSGAD